MDPLEVDAIMNPDYPFRSPSTSSSLRRRVTRVVALQWMVLALLASHAWSQQGVEARGGDYVIGPGDDLNIVVWRNEELTMNVPVRPDGWISLPLVDDVKVSGLTPMQVRDELVARFEEYITAPLVSVIVTRVGSFKVSILGNVRTPGRFDLEGRSTVLDVLALAGGPDEFADKDGIYVLRDRGGAFEKLEFDYGAAIVAEGDSAHLWVRPGDIVIVP